MEADQVFAEALNGQRFVLTAEVALRMSRLLGLAGQTAITNRIWPADGLRKGPIETP